jgi:hypothetical protein
LIEDRLAGHEHGVIERRWETKAARGPSTIFVPVRERSFVLPMPDQFRAVAEIPASREQGSRTLRMSPIWGAFLGILIYAKKLNMSEGT